MGHKDEQEVDRLEATCPRKHYTAADYEYTRKKVYFTIYALASALEMLRIDLLARLALVATFAGGDDKDDLQATASEKAMGAFKELMWMRKGKRDGWLQFCQCLGVDPDAMTAPFLEHMKLTMEAVSEAFTEDSADESSTANAIAARELEALKDAWGETT